jgi:hypothetical protein
MSAHTMPEYERTLKDYFNYTITARVPIPACRVMKIVKTMISVYAKTRLQHSPAVRGIAIQKIILQIALPTVGSSPAVISTAPSGVGVYIVNPREDGLLVDRV